MLSLELRFVELNLTLGGSELLIFPGLSLLEERLEGKWEGRLLAVPVTKQTIKQTQTVQTGSSRSGQGQIEQGNTEYEPIIKYYKLISDVKIVTMNWHIQGFSGIAGDKMGLANQI